MLQRLWFLRQLCNHPRSSGSKEQPRGETGERGPAGEQGPAGIQGPQGEKGDTGEKPNLFKSLDEYHVDLSASGSTLNIPLGSLILTYQNTSTSIESQTYNNTTVSTRTVLDDLVYNLSQESHSMKIRQQNPETKLWSLCEIHSFISNGAARTSIWIQWSEIDVSYEAPFA